MIQLDRTALLLGELRQEWRADLERRNAILASLFRQVGIGSLAYQMEYARIGIIREHLAALDDLAQLDRTTVISQREAM